MSVGNAAVALPKHTAESADTLGIPPTVVSLPSQRNTKTEVSITGETAPTGPVMVAHNLEKNKEMLKLYKELLHLNLNFC